MITRNIFFILLLVIMLGACAEGDRTSPEPDNPEEVGFFVSHNQFTNLRMQNATLIDTVLTERIELKGRVTVAPDSEFDLSLPFSGQVTEIAVSIGDEVRKGQPLLVVKSAEYAVLQERHQKAEAQFDYLTKQAERSRVLNDAEYTSTADRERIESDLGRAQSEVQSLRAQLDMAGGVTSNEITNRLVIRAEHAGVVTEILVNQGHFLEAYRPALTLLDPSGMRLDLAAFDHQVMSLQPGAEVEFGTIGSGSRLVGTLTRIVPKGKGQSQAFQVIVERGGADWSSLEPGLMVSAVAKGAQHKVRAFPVSALSGDPMHPSLFAVHTSSDLKGYRYQKVHPENVIISGNWAGIAPNQLENLRQVLAVGTQHITYE